MTARIATAAAVFVCVLIGACPAVAAPDVAGLWSGTVYIEEAESSMVVYLEVVRDADGALSATARLGGPDGEGQRADSVIFTDGTLRVDFESQDALVEGTLSDDGQRIEGRVGRGGDFAPLALTRVERPAPRPESPPEQETGVGGSAFHKNDITYSAQVETPHVKWATKLPGGAIKGFFIPSVQYGRDLVELMQRLELGPTTVSIDREWDVNCWGIGDYYGHEERGDRDDFKVVYGYVERDLTGPAHFEVMVIPGLNGWSRMTRASRDAILRRVQEGAGLVLIHPFVGDVENHPFEGDEEEGDTRLWDISPLVGCPNDTVADSGYPERNTAAIATGKWEVAQRHFITDGISLDLLPEGVVGGSFYKYRASGDVLVRSGEHPIIAVKQYGKGRVVALAYVEQGFMPEPVDAVATRIYWDYWEYQYALLARCILWAADRDGELIIDGFRAGPNAAEIALFTPGPRRVLLEVTGGSAFGAARGPASAECQVVRDLPAGQNAIRVEVPMPHGLGKNIVSLIVRDAATGATLNWGAASFALDQPARLNEVTLSDTVYLRGDVLAASVRASGDLAGLSVRFQVSDDLGRILCAQTSPAAADATVEYRLAEFLGRYASVTAELVDSKGLVVDQLRATPVYVAPAQRRNREYRASLGFSSIRPYFGALRLNLMNAAGVQAGTTWSEGVDNGLDIPHSYFGVYWYRRGPTTKEGLDQAIADYQGTGDFEALSYNTKLELYSRTKDKRFLERTPCFDDAAILTDLYDRCHASAQAKSEYNMDYYFVGDEGSLTSYRDAFDFCWGEHTLAAFREWLEAEYGSLEALNAEWRTDFKDWQSVVPYTTEEAAASGNFAPWADHRTYMEIVFARAYKTARDGVVAADPDGHIAVSGTQATNAYNGCDWYRLDQVIDDFLSYRGGNQWDLHRSFAKPGSMIGFWTGYGSSGLGVQNGIWSAAIHSVLYPSIFWIYSYLNPDFTYSTSARDMGEAFSQLRFEGVGRLFAESERLHDGIAVHFSMPSVHADSIYRSSHSDQETLRSLSGATNGWVRMIKDLAMQFDFVSYDQIERRSLTSGEYRVLVLPLSLALSPEELQAIEAFAEGGGIVIADAGAGMVDDHCAWVEAGGLNDFFGIATAPSNERVLAQMPGTVTVTPEGEAWGLEAESLEGVDAVEAVAATTGRALLRIGDTDAVVVRQVGTGWAVYLNACLDRYGRWGRRRRGAEGDAVPPDTGPSYRSLVGAVLAHLDVVPAVQVLDMNGQPLSRAQVVRYRFGQDEAVAIVTATVGARAAEGRDGVMIYHDENLGDVARQEITIRLPRAYHVTNARTGEQLGYTDTVRTTITLGGALALGLAKEQNSLSVAGPASATLGDHPQFIVRSSRPDRALVRAHFYGPDGAFLHLYAQNVLTENGIARVAIPSALNDQAGEYTVQATDVISGATAVTKIMLEPPVWAPSG